MDGGGDDVPCFESRLHFSIFAAPTCRSIVSMQPKLHRNHLLMIVTLELTCMLPVERVVFVGEEKSSFESSAKE
jgi:hypothetical protein